MTIMAEEKKPRKQPKNEQALAFSEMDDEMKGILFDEDDYAHLDPEDIVPSGSLSLDMALGIGGYPRGCILDVFGPESAGKSLLSILLMAQVQRIAREKGQGGMIVVWDAERSYSKNLDWMRVNGVDTSKVKFLKLKPTQGAEIGFNTLYNIISAGALDLAVIDSIPSLIPQAALDREFVQTMMPGARAGMLTNVLPRFVGAIDDSKAIVMCINQMRANMDMNNKYAPREKETSNWSLKHWSTIRMQVNKMGKPNEENDVPVSHRVRVKIIKNKVGKPYRKAEFDLNYTRGVEVAGEVADIMLSAGLITQKGAWYYLGDDKYNGLDKFVTKLRGEPALLAEYREKVLALGKDVNAFGIRDQSAVVPDEDGGEDGLAVSAD